MSGRALAARGRLREAVPGVSTPTLVGWAATAAALLWATLNYRAAYRGHFAVRLDPAFPQWWEWTDQGRYYLAAKAWATGSLDPSQHWYFAGYPLLGAALFRLSPGHPFYLVDLACLMLFGTLLVVLAGRLSSSPTRGRLIGAATFVITVVLPPYQMKAFIEPWTTTPTAPLTLAVLLLAFRLRDEPTPRRAAGLGLATASVLLFRPADVAPLALVVAASTGLRVRLAAAGMAGAAIPVVVAVSTYVAVFGLSQSPYLAQSAQTGFEWRLIPLHWVTLFVSPLPEFRDEFSLAQTFAWIIPGLAGMVACLIVSRGEARRRHWLVIAAVGLHCVLYLAYRDLHPHGLFRFGNYHYFKWCLPVFGLYAAFLLSEALLRRRLVAVAVGLAVAGLLFSWRMTWQDIPAPWLAEARQDGEHTLFLPQPPRSVDDGLFIPADGGLRPIYLADHQMRVGDQAFGANADFKAFPVEGGMILTVLRPLPAGPTSLVLIDPVRLRPGPLRLLRAHLFWRWPHLVDVAATYYHRWLSSG